MNDPFHYLTWYLQLSAFGKFHEFCNFCDNLSTNQRISMKLYILKALRAWMPPFSFRADIWSYLPLAKFHCFCNFRNDLCSNEWTSMKLCSCKSLSAWMVVFSFWPDICSYLPFTKFHEFCNFRDNLSTIH